MKNKTKEELRELCKQLTLKERIMKEQLREVSKALNLVIKGKISK